MRKLRPINFLLLTLAGIINAVGITLFLQPVGLYDSGISGTAMLLDRLTPEMFTLSIFLVVINVPLFLYGLKKQGVAFTVYAIYVVAVYALAAWGITALIPMTPGISPFAGDDLLLCAVFGGLISGMGSGLAIRFGGAMDGIDVMAVIFAKRLGISVGTFVMAYNVVLYVLCGILFQNWTLPLYSIITYFVGLKTIDFIVDGFDRAKCANIVTTKPLEVCAVLSETFETGATYMPAKGGYTHTDRTMIYFIVNRFQVTKMRDLVHEIDPMAYISISDVADVFSANKEQ